MAAAQTHDGILAVPVIDIAPFRDPDANEHARNEVARAVDTAARTVGWRRDLIDRRGGPV